MTFANAAGLIRLLLRQSDRHPIRAVGAAELAPYNPRLVRSLRNLGVLVDREDLQDDGHAVFQTDDDVLIVIDPETGECDRHDDDLDIRAFDIDIAALCRAIREQSGLKGPGPVAISTRIWWLGRYDQHGRSAEICLVRRLRDETAQQIVDHARGAIDSEAPIALINLGEADLPTVVARQLDSLRITLSQAADLLRDDPARPFTLDLDRVRVPTGSQNTTARLQIDRIGRRVIFEETELRVEPRDFDVFCQLAEEAQVAGGWVSSDSLAATLHASTQRDGNPEQVDRCINRLRDAFRKNPGLSDIPNNGFIVRKSKVGSRLTFSPAEIAFIA